VNFVDRVREIVCDRARRAARSASCPDQVKALLPGKMLRTRLASRFVDHGVARVALPALERVCAATELAHTASLCHDDVIDGAFIRRSQPVLWRVRGVSLAVLIGDLLLCEAMDLLTGVAKGRYVPLFVTKIREVCVAETEQELAARGHAPDEAACVDIARRKTGPLFAFVARACGGEEEPRSTVLEEVGYRIGAAYQLADDWVDAAGDESIAGKTLGTDARRSKFTLANTSRENRSSLHTYVCKLLRSAIRVSEHEQTQAAARDFLRLDLQPVFDRLDSRLGADLRLAI